MIDPETRTQESAQLNAWLDQLVARKGSDLLLVPKAPASVRVEGSLVVIGNDPLTGEQIEATVLPALAAHAREVRNEWGVEASGGVPGSGLE